MDAKLKREKLNAVIILTFGFGLAFCSISLGAEFQISPNPNPSGNTITLDYYIYDSDTGINNEEYENKGTIKINDHASLKNYNSIKNSGLIDNCGATSNNMGATINNSGTIYNHSSGDFYNAGTINNSGVFNNSSNFRNIGIFNNLEGYSASLGGNTYGYTDSVINNYGDLEFTGYIQNNTINNFNVVTVAGGAKIEYCDVDNFSTFTNNGTITEGGSIHASNQFNNHSSLESTGYFKIMNTTNYGTIDNSGNFIYVNNQDEFNNSGTLLSPDNSGVINNSGTIGRDGAPEYFTDEEPYGIITNSGTINNSADGIMKFQTSIFKTYLYSNNQEYIDEYGIHSNSGIIYNEGTMNIEGIYRDYVVTGGILLYNKYAILENTSAIENYGTFDISGNLENTGSVDNENYGIMNVTELGLVNNNSYIEEGTGNTYHGSIRNLETATINIAAGGRINNDGNLRNIGGTLNNAGEIQNTYTIWNGEGSIFNNTGSLNSDFFVFNYGQFNNSGTFNNSLYLFQYSIFNNTSIINNDGIVQNYSVIHNQSSGTFNVKNNGFIENMGNIYVETNATMNIEAGGVVKNLSYVDQQSGDTINGWFTNSETGTVNISDGGSFENDAFLTNLSGATINNAGTINNTGTFRNEGQLNNTGTIINDYLIFGTGTFNNSGRYQGTGTFWGDLDSGIGTIAPGNSPGTMVVYGNFLLSTDGTLEIEIGGFEDGEHDFLDISGTATLADGQISLSFLDGYDISADVLPGQTKSLMFLDTDGGIDSFASAVNYEFLGTPPGFVYSVYQDGKSLYFEATNTIPAPGAFVLGCIGVGCVSRLRKRKSIR